MEVIIRRREKSDCMEKAHVVTICWQETFRGIVNDEYLDSMPKVEKEWGQNAYERFDEADNHQFVLVVDGKIVGHIKVGLTDDKEYKGVGELFSIYIMKKYQGLGFGKKLTDAGIDELKKLGCKQMLVGCLEGNPSNNYYIHLGGKFIKKRPFNLPPIANVAEQKLTENVYLFDKI